MNETGLHTNICAVWDSLLLKVTLTSETLQLTNDALCQSFRQLFSMNAFDVKLLRNIIRGLVQVELLGKLNLEFSDSIQL